MKPIPVSVLLLSPLLALSANATVLMLDFGPTTVTTPANLINSPYHTVNGAAGTSWNKVSNASNTDGAVPDITSGLLFSDGSVATGVGVNLGVATGTTLGLSTQPNKNTALGSNYNTGIYSGDSVGKDGVFLSTNVAIGLQVTGLTAGIYDVYLATRNTSFSGGQTQTSYVGTGAAGVDYDYSGYVNSALVFASGAAAPTTWVQGESYVKLTVNLTAGQALNIAVAGNADRGFLNAVQIVSVPEPGYGVMACSLLVTLAFRRQPRKG